MKWWKERKAQGKYLMYFSIALFIHTFILVWGTFSQYEVSLKLYCKATAKHQMHVCWHIIYPPQYERKSWPFCCRDQLNNDSHWRSRDDGRPRTMHIGKAWRSVEGLFIDLVPTSTKGAPLTWQTKQIRQRKEQALSIVRIIGTAVWPLTILPARRHKRAPVWFSSTLIVECLWH